ncbi:hypothetical protein GCM10025762_12990 [Haloechinothrix salitolerans]
MSSRHDPGTRTVRPARRDVRAAWISLAFLPVSFVLAMLVGEWLLSVQGYESGAEDRPLIGAALLAGIPAVVVLVAPATTAAFFGWRARQRGDRGGVAPAVVGMVVAVALIALNIVAAIVGD